MRPASLASTFRDGQRVWISVSSTSPRETPGLPSPTKRIAVQMTFDNFGRAIQDVYATTLATTAPVSNPVAFNARGDELLGLLPAGEDLQRDSPGRGKQMVVCP